MNSTKVLDSMHYKIQRLISGSYQNKRKMVTLLQFSHAVENSSKLPVIVVVLVQDQKKKLRKLSMNLSNKSLSRI